MTSFDYITGIALIAVVVLQMRVRTLTLRSLLLPLGLVAGATTSPVGRSGSSPWCSRPTARSCHASACSSSEGSVPCTPRTAALPVRTAPTIHAPWPVRPYEGS